MRAEVKNVIDLFSNGKLEDVYVRLILEFSGIAYFGKKSVCWIEFSRPRYVIHFDEHKSLFDYGKGPAKVKRLP
jgi:hypothetical protein